MGRLDCDEPTLPADPHPRCGAVNSRWIFSRWTYFSAADGAGDRLASWFLPKALLQSLGAGREARHHWRRLGELRGGGGARACAQRRQLAAEVILWSVRWYLMFPISDRDLGFMLQDRGIGFEWHGVDTGVVQRSFRRFTVGVRPARWLSCLRYGKGGLSTGESWLVLLLVPSALIDGECSLALWGWAEDMGNIE